MDDAGLELPPVTSLICFKIESALVLMLLLRAEEKENNPNQQRFPKT